MQVETVPVGSLIPDPSNARKHSDKNLDAIKGSLAKFGQQKPIVVDRNNVVIAGNGTLEAAKALGWETISINRSELEGTDATAFAIADNRSSELAEWDDDVLGKTLHGLREVDFDLGGIGFDLSDLDGMIESTPDFDPGTENDQGRIDEKQINWITCPHCDTEFKDIDAKTRT